MRNICIVTGSRAEYGLLRSVMQEIQAAETGSSLFRVGNLVELLSGSC